MPGMFVLPRRTLQTMLHALDLPLVQAKGLADRLNARKPDRQAAMWEVTILWSLSRQGRVVLEAAQSNGRRPDVHFEQDGFAFVADITTLSDAGLEKEAGREALWDDLQRLVTKAGLSGNQFSLEMRGERIGAFGDTKVKMALPEPAARAAVVKTHLEPFVRRVKASGQAQTLAVQSDGLDFTLGFDPNQRYASQSFPSYTAPESLERNPLFNRLKEKSSQLRGVDETLPRGLIVCDGGADLMRRKDGLVSRGPTRIDIAKAFLDRRDSFDFVLLVSVLTERPFHAQTSTYTLRMELVAGAKAQTEGRLAGGRLARLAAIVEAAGRALPPLVNDPLNVAIRVLEPKAPDMIGGYTRNPGMIKISSRVLLELLSGQLSIDRFREAYGWSEPAGQSGANPFAKALEQGKLITTVSVAASETSDDDWLEFRFGAPDPAIAPFTPTPTSED